MPSCSAAAATVPTFEAACSAAEATVTDCCAVCVAAALMVSAVDSSWVAAAATARTTPPTAASKRSANSRIAVFRCVSTADRASAASDSST